MKTESIVPNPAALRRASRPTARPAAAPASATPGAETAVIFHHEATMRIEAALLPNHATLGE